MIEKTSNGVLHWFVNVQFIYELASLIIMDIQPRELMCSQYTISMKKIEFLPYCNSLVVYDIIFYVLL